MPNSSKITPEVNQALQGIQHEPFSAAGFSTLKEKIRVYISSLVDESRKTAKRAQTDTISAVHVHRASEYLVSGKRRKLFRHLGTVGGLISGGALSSVLSMSTADTIHYSSMIIILAVFVFGAVLVAIHIIKD